MEGHAKKGTTQASPAKPAATGAKNDTAAVPDERAILAKVHKLEKSVTEKAQLDNIPELLRTCTDAASTATVTFNTVRVLQRVFMHLAAKEVLDLGASEDKKEANKQQPLKAAALSHYKAFVRTLIALLLHRHDQVKTLALKVLMEFLHKKTIAFNAANKENSFPLKHFAVVIERLVSESNGKETGLFSQFVGKYLSKYDDIRYYTLKSLRILCEQKKSAAEQSPTNDTVLAMYLLLQKVTMPESDQHITSFWIPVQTKSLKALSAPAAKPKKKNKKSKLNEYERMEQKKQKKRTQTKIASKKSDGSLAVKFAIGHKKIFEACWLAFLALPLTTPIYKDILRRMDTHILPYMVQPIRLIDFLKDSYDVGGVVSLLALHGLFILITKHNLDYPDFYRKLYALFQPNIFHVKYRAKFFRLVNIFLKSSHLPSYLIAAFVKRMARMALHAPPSGALFVIAFVYNMLKRHPQIQIMLHHADDLTTGGSLLPVDTRKPTGVKKNEEAVLMLAPSAEAAAAPANDSVFMLDSNSSSNGAGADGNNKRKRGDEEEAVESAEAKEEENQTAANGSAAPVEAQGKKKRRRRGRGGANKQNGEEEGMDGVEETDAQPPAEEEKNSDKKNVSTGPIEENENELARYTHSGAQGSDPFSFEELDPQKCKALSSSLWELKTLQHHYVPQVSKLAKIFDEPPVKQAFDLEDFIELSYLSLFEAHVKRKTKSPTALAYQPQETLFSVSDSFQADWTFA